MLERCIFCGGEMDISELPPQVNDGGAYCAWHARCKFKDPFSNRTENDLIMRDLLDEP